ncbi:hypothetical protein F4781DRAFT_431860 [Annulohypoxylon bovei var. microspora]|nr:hypothetical protein F4781DRAFT_431860 [Annulohypoxylon bovei var. microspora]
MAGNQRNPNINGSNGPHRPYVPIPPVSSGSRPTGPQQVPVHQLPGPSRAGLPVNVARGPSIQISDVSRDLKTINDMKEDLTEYAIFRFEKISTQNKYDDEGRPQLPTWDRAIRTRVPGMSPREIVREIQHLNRNTRNLTDKLKTLSPVIQRQIDVAQEDLASSNSDPMNYHWVLAQLDHQLREIAPCVVMASVNHSTPRRRYDSTKRRSYRRSSRHRGKSYERISLRAYFKRTPRQNVDITMLWEAKNLQNSHIARPHPHPHQHPQQHSNQHSHQNPHIPQQPRPQPNSGLDPRTQRQGAGSLAAGTSFGPDNGRGPPPVVLHPNKPAMGNRINYANNTRAGNRDTMRARGQGPVRNQGNDGDLESDSDYSNYLSMDGSLDTQITPDTSQDGSPIHGRNRMPARNKNTMQDSNSHNRRSLGDQQYFNVNNGPRVQSTPTPGPPRPPPPPPPLPMVPPIDIERVRDEAYLEGMRHGRDGARISQERGYREGRRSRYRPQIISAARSPMPPYRRRMPTSDPEASRHRRNFDEEINRFNRLSLDDEDNYGPVLRRADARQRREFEYLLQHGSVLGDDPFDRDRPSYSRHGSRQYQEPYVEDGSDSDLSLPERGNRWFRY